MFRLQRWLVDALSVSHADASSPTRRPVRSGQGGERKPASDAALAPVCGACSSRRRSATAACARGAQRRGPRVPPCDHLAGARGSGAATREAGVVACGRVVRAGWKRRRQITKELESASPARSARPRHVPASPNPAPGVASPFRTVRREKRGGMGWRRRGPLRREIATRLRRGQGCAAARRRTGSRLLQARSLMRADRNGPRARGHAPRGPERDRREIVRRTLRGAHAGAGHGSGAGAVVRAFARRRRSRAPRLTHARMRAHGRCGRAFTSTRPVTRGGQQEYAAWGWAARGRGRGGRGRHAARHRCAGGGLASNLLPCSSPGGAPSISLARSMAWRVRRARHASARGAVAAGGAGRRFARHLALRGRSHRRRRWRRRGRRVTERRQRGLSDLCSRRRLRRRRRRSVPVRRRRRRRRGAPGSSLRG